MLIPGGLNQVMLKSKVRSLFNLYYARSVSNMKNVTVKGSIVVRGKPIIDIKDGSSLILNNNITLNSSNYGYHINMHSPVKLFADRKGAKIVIGENTRIHGTCIHAYEKIYVGARCLIAANCQIFDGSGHELSFPDIENRINTVGGSSPVIIEDDVWIGANSIILPGVTIGKGSVIAAGSIVTKNIPPYSVAGGNPARTLKVYEGMK